ncbi:ORF2 [Rodent Torque teno virus 1]|uniref:ORF2 n=1 Tax=Rodent Torque teno virus 1 TaxID=1514664 RepID=X2G8B2_9VIRU|nr:ORF2 [Rodent Torque teno virus 1]AHN14856.1 ORF2 [Rodent Torque teno virus 1]
MNIDEDFVYKEDSWICMVRQAHELFCSCSSWTTHLKTLLDFNHPEWRGDSQDREPGEGKPGDQPDGAPTDEELLGVLEELENGDAGEGTSRSECSLKYSLDTLGDVLSEALCVLS